MNLQDVRYEKRGAVAVLTLDREGAGNAYSEAMIESLVAAVDQADADAEVHCLVVTGAGKVFSAGGDLKRMRTREGMFEGGPVSLRDRYVHGIHTIPRRLARFEKPVVAAVNGSAVGAGLDLACMCDIRIAASSARFGSPFVKLGLVPGDGGAYFLARVVGFPRALEMMLTGRLLDSAEAERMGLVHRVVEDGEALAAALEVAEQLSRLAPLALRLTKAACYQSWEAGMDAALNLAATYQGMLQNTADHMEGVLAAIEKRPPMFRGE